MNTPAGGKRMVIRQRRISELRTMLGCLLACVDGYKDKGRYEELCCHRQR